MESATICGCCTSIDISIIRIEIFFNFINIKLTVNQINSLFNHNSKQIYKIKYIDNVIAGVLPKKCFASIFRQYFSHLTNSGD